MTSQYAEENKSNLGSSPFGKAAETRLSPQPRDQIVVEVSLDLTNRVLESYLVELYEYLRVEVLNQTAQKELPFTVEDLRDYSWILIHQRVCHVVGQRVAIKAVDRFNVPAFLHLILAQLGKAEYVSRGITLIPALPTFVDYERFAYGDTSWKFQRPGQEGVVRDVKWMSTMSKYLQFYSKFGFEYGVGYDRDKAGSFEFMSMCVIDDHVMGHDEDVHPVYALLAAVLSLRGAESVLSPRVDYGDMDEVRNLMRVFAAPKPYFSAE